MSIFSASGAQFVSDRLQADRTTSRQRSVRPKSAEEPSGRGEDELDLQVQNTQTLDAVRSLKGSTDEETADEKPRQPAQSHEQPAKQRPHIDLQG